MPRRLSSEKKTELAFFIPLFFLCLFLSYQINFYVRNYKYEIENDKAGYYVYLPATFIYGWDINKFPAGIMDKTHSFVLDKKTNKIIDKYTCGVAILWAPFFLITHFIAVQRNLQPDGFSDFYQHMTVLPEVFYLILALLFLRRFLRFYVSRLYSYLAIIFLVAGTNLYFFSIDDGLMSHLSSFFLFSIYLYLLKKFLISEKKSYRLFCLISLVIAMVILVRPTNIIILAWILFLDVGSLKDIQSRLRLFINLKYILTFAIITFIVFLPQLIYWRYLSGHFVYYSYKGESFSNWKDPQLIPFWFSPLNGLFIYSPLALIFVIGITRMIRKKIPNGIFIGLFFLLVSYVYSSWYTWFFGGSFGCRPFIEYYSLMSLPFALLIQSVPSWKNLFLRSLLALSVALFTYYSLMLTYNYWWNSSSTWAWDQFLKDLDKRKVLYDERRSFKYVNDFENPGTWTDYYGTRKSVHSPTLAGFCTNYIHYSAQFSQGISSILKKPLEKVDVSIWINPQDTINTGALVIFSINEWNGKSLYNGSIKVDDFVKKPNQWAKVQGTFYIPEWVSQDQKLSLFLWNKQGKNLFLDDVVYNFQ